MKKKIMSNWKWIGSALVAIIALALFTGAVAIAGQTVTQRDGTVDLDNRVDLEDADDGYIDGIDIAAETISVTKTVNPPDGHSFKEFDEPLSGSGTKTRVDILPSSLTGCTASRGPESGSSITVEWEYPKDSFSEDPCYFPFALDGNLETGGIGGTGGSNGEGDGEAHWAVKMTDFTGSVAITQVPKYLFANATAAIPVKFQIDGLGDQVEIHGVKVEWHYGSGSVTSRELKSRTASGDGLGSAVDNETSSTLSNIYTTWVPISLIGTDIEGDTTNDAYFVVRVNARKKGYCDGPYHLVSDRDKDWDDSLTTPYVSVGCNPKIFGDQNVKITELYGPNTEFSVLETATRQKRCMNAPTNEWWHLRDGSDNAPVPYTKHKLLPRDSTACEHCDALVGSGTHVLGWYDRIRTVSTAADERDKEVMKVFQMLYSKCGRAGSHTLQLRKYDITVGCRFAVSYPHRTDVTVLGTSPGLDMMAGHRFTQTNLVKALANGSVELSVGDLGVAPTTAIDWTAIGSSLYNMATAVVALTQPEIAAAMVVVKETYRLVMGNTTQDSSVFERAECYAVGGWTQIKADGTTGDYTRWQHHNNGSKGETFVPQTASLTRQLALEVGDTFVGAVRLGATCTLRTPVNSGFHDDGRDIDWDKISVAAKYKLTQGTFADTDIIHIHTNPN